MIHRDYPNTDDRQEKQYDKVKRTRPQSPNKGDRKYPGAKVGPKKAI